MITSPLKPQVSSPKPPHRRGVTLVIAMFLIAFVGLAMVAVSSMLANQSRRARRLATEAQLQQLLLAGERCAATWLDSSPEPEQTRDIHMPDALAGKGTALRLTAQPQSHIHVTASIDDVTWEQTLRYRREAGRWVLAEAALQ